MRLLSSRLLPALKPNMPGFGSLSSVSPMNIMRFTFPPKVLLGLKPPTSLLPLIESVSVLFLKRGISLFSRGAKGRGVLWIPIESTYCATSSKLLSLLSNCANLFHSAIAGSVFFKLGRKTFSTNVLKTEMILLSAIPKQKRYKLKSIHLSLILSPKAVNTCKFIVFSDCSKEKAASLNQLIKDSKKKNNIKVLLYKFIINPDESCMYSKFFMLQFKIKLQYLELNTISAQENMENQMQHQAVLSLLHLGDEETANMHTNPQSHILSEKAHFSKSNTANLNKLHFTIKIKTQGEASVQRSANSTQNKENLKRILQKLKDSPRLPKKKNHKKPEIQFIHIKTLNSEPQSRSKIPQKTPQTLKNSLKKIVQKQRERELIKSLVKAKIVEKLRNMQEKKTQRQLRQESFRISTLREIAGLKRGHMALQRSKETHSYHNLRGEPIANMGAILNGRNGQINLKQLLF